MQIGTHSVHALGLSHMVYGYPGWANSKNENYHSVACYTISNGKFEFEIPLTNAQMSSTFGIPGSEYTYEAGNCIDKQFSAHNMCITTNESGEEYLSVDLSGGPYAVTRVVLYNRITTNWGSHLASYKVLVDSYECELLPSTTYDGEVYHVTY